MLIVIGLTEVLLLTAFFMLERRVPARAHRIVPLWNLWFLAIVCFSLAWLKVMLYFWVVMDTPSILPIKAAPVLVQGLIFYAIYSFGNYWFHRWKHASGILWRCLHRFHHAPTHMESRVAFYRHPLEILANTLYLFLLGKFLVGVPAEGVAIALAIEASLEIFHHSNIRIPPKYRGIGYVVQIPEMHLIHHQQGLHRYNYAPILWDWVFGTVHIPVDWRGKVGFADSDRIARLFFLKPVDES